MKLSKRNVLLFLLLVFVGAAGVVAVRPTIATTYEPDQSEVARLRTRGPAALESLFDELSTRRVALAAAQAADAESAKSKVLAADVARLEALIDQVGGQRYCYASRLFWYTDFEQAKEAARESGKPILSLRMLGNLTDELSCANSRFFRTTLYANKDISDHLRDHFILHWKSVRPVPTVTVDFGDGRKLIRTVTGNSAHYVLSNDGRVIDVLPGLYGPSAFLDHIQRAEDMAARYVRADVNDRTNLLRAYHQQQLAQINQAWTSDMQQLGLAMPQPNAAAQRHAAGNGIPAAEQAAVIARPKARAELPLIRNITLTVPAIDDVTSEETWQRIADLHQDDAKLDQASTELIMRQNPTATDASELAITKRVQESPLLRMLRTLRSSIALDTVRNEYQLHRRIHEWLLSEPEQFDVDGLNERVYADLFLTPSSDPWLGLVPRATYTALENNGLRVDR